MVRINWTFQARDDLKSIADYISKDSVRYAEYQIIRIKKRTEILKQHIHIGRIVPEINNDKIRELIEGNYRIIYKTVNENRVDILTVHHSARNLNPEKTK